MSAGRLRFQTAVDYFRTGRSEQAAEVCRELLAAQPEHVEALHLLGTITAQAGRLPEAAELLQRAAAHRPGDAGLLNNLGECLRQLGRLTAAVTAFKAAIAAARHVPEPHYNLGIALKALDRSEEAIASFRRAVALRPGYDRAHYNLANLLREEGRIKTAVGHYQAALAARPDWADAHLNLGVVYYELGESDSALAQLREALRLDPTKDDVEVTLGHVQLAQGDVVEAAAAYRRALARRPEQPLSELRIEALSEVIPPGSEYIDEYQTRILPALERWAERHPTIDLATLHLCGAEPSMSLAYQGRDVGPIMDGYGAVFAARIAPVELQPNVGKPRLGIVVTNGHEGVFARCWGGIAERLAREKLEVRVICSRAGANVLKQLIRIAAEEYLVLPERLDVAARRLAEARFDLLHYWELGTDSTNYFLPYFQPAPLQCGNWGWPVTSGNPRVSHYVSAAQLEPAGAQRQYRETLVPLPSLPVYYERPPLPRILPDRAQFGFSEQEHLYLCTQNLRKYHPDFDPLLAEILAADSQARLLLIADAQPGITGRLLARLRPRIHDFERRVTVLPRLERPEYLNVLALADVVLDTLHYGGGANTVYDAVAVGAPIVSLPGPFQRGRWTSAVYAQLGLTELLAASPADYVRLALRTAAEPERRRELAGMITAAGAGLFADRDVVRAHEELFLRLIAERRASADS